VAKHPVEFVEMHERLRQDTDGIYRRAVLAELESLGSETKSKLDAGVSPDDFKPIAALKAAVDEAKVVVDQAWSALHQTP
jgi:hypothetical protein